MVVIVLPFERFLADLAERFTDIGVQEFAPDAAIEAFNVGVLRGLAGLNAGQCDLALFAPGLQLMADELRTVIDTDHTR